MQLFIKGYLHRDVTVGNILAHDRPQERTAVMREKNDDMLSRERFVFRLCGIILVCLCGSGRFKFLNPYLTSCLGFMIDGDLAIKWAEGRVPGKDRSVGIVWGLVGYVG